ncbi:ankyrin repeat-containing protein BDA1-like [Gossypium arboreum]|uniref:ankyrin repeat-containing protein BDA1-like n=1 Tax=Gossypium arboreum TaxID=29729 RepID=UPI0008192F9E|nr:ankyrin repeat-containing protein BDA1-like [Gossypium arboreum]
MLIDFLSVDKDLIRVEGKGGFSVLHHVALDENYIHLLSRVLNTCPDCIFDLTVRRQTALHIAAESNNFEAFKAMLEWIQSAFEDNKSMRSKILNFQDKDSNTVLHLAASINHPQMIKLLIECGEVDKNKINDRGFTAMDVLQRQTVADNTESVNILSSNPLTFQKLSKFKLLRDEIKEMRDKTMGVLLFVFSLVLTMTYQGVLRPPGSISQGDATESASSNHREGKSVMKVSSFLLFYIPNGAAFIISWVMTQLRLESVAKSIMSFLSPIYLMVCFCSGVALSTIAPSTTLEKGLYWWVGNGRSITIWNNDWLPGIVPSCIVHSSVTTTITWVSDLMLQGLAQWNHTLVRELFSTVEADRILSILLSRQLVMI